MKLSTLLIVLIAAFLGVVALNALNLMFYMIGRAVGGGLLLAIIVVAIFALLRYKKK